MTWLSSVSFRVMRAETGLRVAGTNTRSSVLADHDSFRLEGLSAVLGLPAFLSAAFLSAASFSVAVLSGLTVCVLFLSAVSLFLSWASVAGVVADKTAARNASTSA